MPEICETCGLPKEICVCAEISREAQRIKIYTVKRKYGKLSTIVEGFEKDMKLKEIAKDLKAKCACGGTVKDEHIELQGDHKSRVKEILVKMGFSEDMIEIKR